MKAIQVFYDSQKDTIEIDKSKSEEDWLDICERFNNDIHKVRQVKEIEGYTGLYECYDEDNKCFYYIVKEELKLYNIRRKHFLSNIGKDN